MNGEEWEAEEDLGEGKEREGRGEGGSSVEWTILYDEAPCFLYRIY